MKHAFLKCLLTLSLLFVLIFAVSCGEEEPVDEAAPVINDGSTITLNVYNWGEYISDGFEGSYDTNKEFEAYCQSLGLNVKVNYTTYATNEDMYNKLKSGAGTYDIVIPSDYMIQKMANEGMLAEIDFTKVPNYQYIDDAFKGMYYDPNNKYSVPYSYGVVGIIYNTAFVDEKDVADKSWSLLWNENYRNKILQFNNPRDAFGSAMYYMGLDINSRDEAVWQSAYQKLLEQKPLVQGYVSDEIFNKMTTGSAYIAPYYAGDYITMYGYEEDDGNKDLAFYYPKEGTNIFVDAMCIPKAAQNKALAAMYINFMLSKDAAIANAEYIGYASPNTQVYTDPAYIDYMGDMAMEILYGTPSDVINANYKDAAGNPIDPYYHAFDEKTQALVNTLWEGLKTENAIEAWIHVVTALIVAGVIALAVTSVYLRKKRIKDYCAYAESLKTDATPKV